MKNKNRFKYAFSVVVLFMISGFIILNILSGGIVLKKYCLRLHSRLMDSLEEKLVLEKWMPVRFMQQPLLNKTAIYVLGGNQDSLKPRFRQAANLYHQGLSNKIFILSRDGITDYSHDLGRNMTNNEWAIMELESMKIKRFDIEFVSVQTMLFGTFNEARAIPDLIGKKGYYYLILVTSYYHTRRTYMTFSNIACDYSLEYYIYKSNDEAGLGYLLLEYIKMLLYEYVAIPVYGLNRVLS